MIGAGCRLQGAGCWVLDAGCKLQGSGLGDEAPKILTMQPATCNILKP